MRILAASLCCLWATICAAEVRVAAASDLRFALGEIIEAFTNGPNQIKASYGASGSLFAQIQNGAPFDVFLSADTNYPYRLIESGHGTNFFVYATGHLALWAPNSTNLDLEKLGLKSLLDPSVRKIAIANPAHAPYGRAAVAALKAAGIYEAITNSLVLGENVAQTAQFVQSGGADIGIVALSLVKSPAMKGQGRYIEIPSALEQGGVMISRSRNLTAAGNFSCFLTNQTARAIFGRATARGRSSTSSRRTAVPSWTPRAVTPSDSGTPTRTRRGPLTSTTTASTPR
jgi:molybdate transport system substrate-binding protein